MATEQQAASGLEQKLERMLEIERFEPPAEFRERALVRDDSVYDEAEGDIEGLSLIHI